MIKSCLRYGQTSLCTQNTPNTDITKCNLCVGSFWAGSVFDNLSDYRYLIARSKLYGGYELSNIEEYRLLKTGSMEKENIELLDKWLKKSM